MIFSNEIEKLRKEVQEAGVAIESQLSNLDMDIDDVEFHGERLKRGLQFLFEDLEFILEEARERADHSQNGKKEKKEEEDPFVVRAKILEGYTTIELAREMARRRNPDYKVLE